jgi:2,4-didehydro-3-deoxy-L-rhamnonate hydrolase
MTAAPAAQTTPEPGFKLGTFASNGEPFAGLVVGSRVVKLADLLEFGGRVTVLGLLRDWDRSLELLSAAAARVEGAHRLDDLRPMPPIYPPGAFVCAGANYREHVIQMMVGRQVASGVSVADATAAATKTVARRAEAGIPFVFPGFPGAVCGARDDVVLPADGGAEHDWELELAIVVGRHATYVPKAKAMDYVAGYTIVNDISTRDRMIRSDVPLTDFIATKLRPTFKPTGPFITPARFVSDPSALRITLRVNGEVMQDASTSDMLFDVPRLIEYVSGLTELSPGDLILTGSPAGNAAHHGRRFLKPGDVLEGEISGLGRQRNRCISAAERPAGPDSSAMYKPLAEL